MTTATGLSMAEQLILEAAAIDKAGPGEFTAENLAVTAWRNDRPRFGLAGFESLHPNFNVVASAMAGKRGLVARGWLVKVRPKTFRMTKEGRRIAAILNGETLAEPTANYIKFSPTQEKFINGLLASAAYRIFDESRKADLTFTDACRFWDITQGLQGEAVDARLEWIEETLNDLERDLAQEDARLSSGRLITASDIRVLRHIHRYMEDRFDRLLHLLRSRK